MEIEFKGKKYVMDRQAREFRAVDEPAENISFKSSEGWQILNSI